MLMIRPAREEDIGALAPRMRSMDRLECWEMGRHTPTDALRLGLEQGTWTRAAIVDGEVWSMFGVTPKSLLGDTASPWMLNANGIERHARHIVRYSRGYVEAMLADYARLENWVHAENGIAIRWLKWCGFAFGPVVALESGAPFRKFTRERAHV